MPGLTLAELHVTSNYTGTITLTADLTVQGGYINGGTITSPRTAPSTLTIDSAANFTWTAGTLGAPLSGLTVTTTGQTALDINPGNLQVTLTGATLNLYGTTDLRSGKLMESNQSTVNNYGTFTFRAGAWGVAAQWNANNLPDPTFYNNCDLNAAGPQASVTATFNDGDCGTVAISPSDGLFLGGGGTIAGAISLGGVGATLNLSVVPSAPATGPMRYPYTFAPNASIQGTGTLCIYGTISPNGSFLDAQMVLNTDVALPNTVSLYTDGGYISGPAKLTLTAPTNTIQNTQIMDAATVQVGSGARLTIAQSPNYGQSPSLATIVTGGSTLDVAGSGVLNINSVNFYIGPASRLSLTRGAALSTPTVILSGLPANIYPQPNVATTGLIVSDHGIFTSTVPVGVPRVWVPLGHIGEAYVSPGSDIDFGRVQWRRPGNPPANAPADMTFDGGGGGGGVDPRAAQIDLKPGATGLGSGELPTALFNEGTVTPGDVGVGGTMTFDGGFQQTATGLLQMDVGVGGDEVVSLGPVTLDGALQVAPLPGASLPSGPITLISNQSGLPVTGTFSGLPEGAPVSVGGAAYQITYQGGAGNDVVLWPTTTTNVFTSENPATVGDTVTLEASVWATGAGAGPAPAGTVTFYDGTTPLGTAALGMMNYAFLAVSSLAAGAHGITAVYSGDSNYLGSSAGLTETVNRHNLMMMPSGPGSVQAGATFTLSAFLPGWNGLVPTGTVTFTLVDANNNQTALGSATVDSMGNVSISASVAAPGSYTVLVSYGGDANFAATTATLNLNVYAA